jgi:hypothetical protein
VTGTDPIPNRVRYSESDADCQSAGKAQPDAIVAVEDRDASAKTEHAGNRQIELADDHRQA